MAKDFSDFFSDLNHMMENFGRLDPAEYRGNDYGLDDDDGYREWSEVIEKQNQEFQDWESVQMVRFSMHPGEVMSEFVSYEQSKTR